MLSPEEHSPTKKHIPTGGIKMTDYLTIKDADGRLSFDFARFGDDLVSACPTPEPTSSRPGMMSLEIDQGNTTYRFKQENGKGREHRLMILIRPLGVSDQALYGVLMPDCSVDSRRPIHDIWGVMTRLRRKSVEPFARREILANRENDREAALVAASEKFRCLTGLDVERDPKHRRENFAVTLSAGAKEIHLSGEVDQTSTVAMGLSPLSIEDFAYLLKMLERTFARVRRTS